MSLNSIGHVAGGAKDQEQKYEWLEGKDGSKPLREIKQTSWALLPLWHPRYPAGSAGLAEWEKKLMGGGEKDISKATPGTLQRDGPQDQRVAVLGGPQSSGLAPDAAPAAAGVGSWWPGRCCRFGTYIVNTKLTFLHKVDTGIFAENWSHFYSVFICYVWSLRSSGLAVCLQVDCRHWGIEPRT